MRIFKLASSLFNRTTIKPLDCFEKSEKNTPSLWVVDEVISMPNMPDHARLIRQWSGAPESRTVSVVALQDETLYRQVFPDAPAINTASE